MVGNTVYRFKPGSNKAYLYSKLSEDKIPNDVGWIMSAFRPHEIKNNRDFEEITEQEAFLEIL